MKRTASLIPVMVVVAAAAIVGGPGCVAPRDVPLDAGGGDAPADARSASDGRDLAPADAPGADVPGGETGCAADEHACGGACFKNNDVTSCGACGHDCTTLPNIKAGVVQCQAGKCVVPSDGCAAGHAHCTTNPDDVCETDLSNAQTCGACGTRCPMAMPLCTSMGDTFACAVSCAAPAPDRCGASCVDLNTSLANCGACGKACSFPNADAACTTGACAMVKCKDGYGDCTAAPGCETPVNTTDHCGSCNPCGANLKCDPASRMCVDICTGGGTGNNAHCCSNADCPANLPICNVRTCVAKGAGTACAGGGECQSGSCVEGVCCNNACTAKCSSCLMTNTGQPNGTCAAVKAGLAHGNDCTAAAATTCGLDGKCDGAGACRFFDAATTCAPEACTDGAQASSYSARRACDGAGTCKAATTSNCGAVYRCAGTACRTTCGSGNDCTSTAYCAGTTCMAKKPDGALCGSGVECAKGVCGGRCCVLGCTCTQPDPANLVANAGFDQNIAGWTATGGTLAWAGSDALNCPFSGGMRITMAANLPEQTLSFCVHNTPLSGMFNFGIRARPSLSAMTICQANFYNDLNCAGDLVIQNETGSATAAQGWTSLDASLNSSGALSAQLTCYLFSDSLNQSIIDFDMAYISPAPKKF